jgi:single-stranded-DNA-specific exonuclease
MNKEELQPAIIELLKKRGIESDEDIEEFISDKPQRMYDPFLLPDMEAGVDLIMSSIKAGEKICIFGDYDADGVTSTAILYTVLTKLTDNVTYHIPSRFNEGYGLNNKALKQIRDDGVSLVVTVDCGSVSVDEVKYAKEIGLKILVTDHHNIGDSMADCLLINPGRPDSKYPCRYLAGCGVAFKTAQAICQKAGLPKRILVSLMDLAAIGTIGDIVPLVDENRSLAKYGIRVINTGKRRNLNILLQAIGMEPGHVTAENISYVIVPHINAAGRMRSADIALRLFIEKDENEVRKLAEELAECNRKRRELQDEIYDSCVEKIEADYADDPFLLIDMGYAHEGVTGIAAGRLKDHYGKPVVIVTHKKDGTVKGTGRSVKGVDLYDLMSRYDSLYTTFGGHAGACGFTMDENNVDELRDGLVRDTGKIAERNPEYFMKHVDVDLELQPDDFNHDFIKQLDLLEPCGCANEKPVFDFDAFVYDASRMGSDGQYLRFNASPGEGKKVTCVCFNDADRIENVIDEAAGEPLRIAGSLSERVWNGSRYMQFRVMDITEI